MLQLVLWSKQTLLRSLSATFQAGHLRFLQPLISHHGSCENSPKCQYWVSRILWWRTPTSHMLAPASNLSESAWCHGNLDSGQQASYVQHVSTVFYSGHACPELVAIGVNRWYGTFWYDRYHQPTVVFELVHRLSLQTPIFDYCHPLPLVINLLEEFRVHWILIMSPSECHWAVRSDSGRRLLCTDAWYQHTSAEELCKVLQNTQSVKSLFRHLHAVGSRLLMLGAGQHELCKECAFKIRQLQSNLDCNAWHVRMLIAHEITRWTIGTCSYVYQCGLSTCLNIITYT